MCRHLAYLGPPVSLASLVLEPSHSLYEQSWAPGDMRGGGSVNADGFGLGWYVDGEPVRYRRSVPIWADESLPALARSVSSGAVIAAVRNGTVGMPLGEAAVAPFQQGRWFFSHNGLISGWPASVEKLAERLPVTDLLTLDAPLDSALLWALIRDRLRELPAEPPGRGAEAVGSGRGAELSGRAAQVGDGGVTRTGSAAGAVAAVIGEVVAVAPESRLNVLLTDGEQIVATSWTHSLWVRRTEDSVTVSSEPWHRDDPAWQEVPDKSLLTATSTSYAITPLQREGRQ